MSETDDRGSTPRLIVDPTAARPEDLRRISEVLKRGGVMVYPTETFYGMGGDGFSPEVVDRVFRLKRRDNLKALSLVVADTDALSRVAAGLPERLPALAEAFWPGPLTLVVRAAPSLPSALTGGGGTVGVRVPGLPWLRALLREAACPLIATSANLSGESPVREGGDALSVFEGLVDLIVDGGRCPGGLPSTVLDLSAGPPRILREGAVSAERLAPYLA